MVDLEDVPLILGVGVFVAVIIFGLPYINDLLHSDDDSGSNDGPDYSFELTTTETDIGVGQEKILITSMANTKTINEMKWFSSDSNILSIHLLNDEDKNIICIKGLAKGDVTVSASSKGFTETCTVHVSDKIDENQLKVYNMSSKNYDYAILQGDGFEKGVLSLAFNYKGVAAITLSGYTKEMLEKYEKNNGNPRHDFKTVKMIVSERMGGGKVWSKDYSNDNSSDGSMLISVSGLSTGIAYDVVFSVTLYNGVSYDIKGSFVYVSNDRTLDATNVCVRPYAWRYDGKEFSFEERFPYGYYMRYHLGDFDGNVVYYDYSRNNGTSNESAFCKSNVTTKDICSNLSLVYRNSYGADSSLTGQDYIDFILGFVQINWYYAYDHDQYVTTLASDNVDFWCYPMLTIYSGCGDCEDTSILCATLFKEAGFDSAVYSLPGHAMVGIYIDNYIEPKCSDGYEIMCYNLKATGVSYYGCETTWESSGHAGISNTSSLTDDDGNYYETSKIKIYVLSQ